MTRRNPSAKHHLQEAELYIKGAKLALEEGDEQAVLVRLALADKELKHAFGEPGVARLKQQVLNLRRKHGITRVNPEEDSEETITLLFEDPNLGAEMHQWHAGMGDPIYRVGSLIYAGHPVTTEDVEDARDKLEYLWERRESYDDEAVEQLADLIDNLNYALSEAGVAA